MRKFIMMSASLGIGLSLFGLVFSPSQRLLWNRTGSAPIGLYWMNDKPYTYGQWVVVSANSAEANWAEHNGYVGKDWPLLKQVSGVPGDVICRENMRILINGIEVGWAKKKDAVGRELPAWQGCITLSDRQLFLMNSHAGSLDGRYFGPIEVSEIQSAAQPIAEWR